MKECSIYKLFFIIVTLFILCGFHDDERENTIVPDGSEEYVTTDNDEYCNETFAGSCVASAAAILAFAGLLYSASIWQKQPPVFVEPKESKTACIFINGHKISYDVDLYATVANLKQKIGDRIGSDVIDDQFITFAGKRLSDHKRLIDYNIQMHSTLFLTGKILGGSGTARGRATIRGGMRNIRGGGRRSNNRAGSPENSSRLRTEAQQLGLPCRAQRDNGGRGHLNQRSSGGGRGHGGRAQSQDDGSGINRQPDPARNHSEENILSYGLMFAGFNELRQKSVNKDKNIERFRCCYGVGHKAVVALIKDLPDKDFQLKHLFLALNFLKTYNTQTVLSGWWDISEETVRKWTKHFQLEIQKLKEKKIRGVEDVKYDTVFILTVDGVHFKTFESRKNPTAKVYSHKSNGPAMSYEIAIAIHESRVLAINGPFDASKADITIFRDQLKDAMPKGKRGIGDSGYQGEPGKLSFHRPAHSKEMTNFINRVRARHENFNARIKNFNILSNCFRSNDKAKHKMAFEAVCILCQYDMENGHPLMDVA